MGVSLEMIWIGKELVSDRNRTGGKSAVIQWNIGGEGPAQREIDAVTVAQETA